MKARSVLVAWGLAIAALIVWTAFAHFGWPSHESPLPAVPAFFLGVLLLILGQAVVRWVAGAWRHGLRWWISGASLRLSGWSLLFAASTVVLFYNVELWRGKRAWAAVERQAAERGESLDLQAIIPQPVPEEQNFAAIPLFKPMIAAIATNAARIERGAAPVRVYYGSLPFAAHWEQWPAVRVNDLKYFPWMDQEPTAFRPWLAFWRLWEETMPATNRASLSENGNLPYGPESPAEVNVPEMQRSKAAELVLYTLMNFKPDLDQLRRYSDRPFCRFPLDYSRQMFTQDYGLIPLDGYTRILRLRACALLELGRDEEALRDIQLALRLVDYAGQQPWPTTDDKRLWIFVDAVQPIWEGLTARRWNASQLESLQHQLESLDFLQEYAATVRNDAFAMADMIESAIPTSRGSRVPPLPAEDPGEQRVWDLVRFLCPTGWSLQDQAAIHQFHLQATGAHVNLGSRRVTGWGPVGVLLNASSDPFFPFFIVPKVREMYSVAGELYPFAQTVTDLATVACALERYRVENSQYPASLDALVPRFIATVPHDVITGRPLKYRRTADGRFLLYSVGLNGIDDGGKPCERRKYQPERAEQRYDLDQNDWVWTWLANGPVSGQ